MARRKKGRRSWSRIILWIISFLVVISMVLAYVLTAMPSPPPTATPVP